NDNSRTLAPAAVGSQVALMSTISVRVSSIEESFVLTFHAFPRSSQSFYSTFCGQRTRSVEYLLRPFAEIRGSAKEPHIQRAPMCEVASFGVTDLAFHFRSFTNPKSNTTKATSPHHG